MYEAVITKAANGLIIKVGCQTYVTTDIRGAMLKLGEYYESKNPNEIEKEYLSKYGNGQTFATEAQATLNAGLGRAIERDVAERPQMERVGRQSNLARPNVTAPMSASAS